MKFKVIDPQTQKEVNLDDIQEEEWARGYNFTKWVDPYFVLESDGTLFIIYDHDIFLECPEGRFEIVITEVNDELEN